MSGRTIDYGERGTIVVYEDPDAVARAAADLFQTLAIAATHDRGSASIALSGGTTPKAMCALLARPPYLDGVPWGSTHLFWGDERCVALESPESNAGEALRGFLSVVPIPEPNIVPYDDNRLPSDAATDCERNILDTVPGKPIPLFDLIFLGMGEDGHTASLFPETAALAERDRLVVANVVPKLDSVRMTFTAPLINAARAVAFLTVGANKAERLADVLESDLDPIRLPAQMIRPTHGTLTWLVDEAAASRLSRS